MNTNSSLALNKAYLKFSVAFKKVKFAFALTASLCACAPLYTQDLSPSYKNGLMYYSKFRGGVIEDMYIDKSALITLQQKGFLPNNTKIVVEEYFNENGKKGALNRYIVAQKRARNGSLSPTSPIKVSIQTITQRVARNVITAQ